MENTTPVRSFRSELGDDTIINTPLPQATSTVDRNQDMKLETMSYKPSMTFENMDFLKDSMQVMNSVKERLQIAELKLNTSQVPTRDSCESSKPSTSRTGEFDTVRPTAVSYIDLNSSDEELEHDLVRSRALKMLNVQSHAPSSKRPSTNREMCSVKENSGVILTDETVEKETSGFSNILTPADLDKDEAWCKEQYYDIPVQPMSEDMSMSGILQSSNMTSYFMAPSDGSFFKHSQPVVDISSDESDQPEVVLPTGSRPNTSLVANSTFTFDSGIKSGNDMLSLSCESRTSSLPTIEEIAETLKALPPDVSGRFIMDKVLEVSEKSKKGSETKAKSNSDSDFDESAISISDSSDDDCKEFSHTTIAVLCGGTEVHIPCVSITKWELVSRDLEHFLWKVVKMSDEMSKLQLLPLKVGTLSMVLFDTRNKKEGMSWIKHNITLISEQPKIELLSNEIVYFGKVAEQCLEIREIILKSNNSNVCSLRHNIVMKDGSSNDFFSLKYEDLPDINFAPGETITFNVGVKPPIGTVKDKNDILSLSASLEFFINIPEHYHPKIVVAQMVLTSKVFLPTIEVDNKALLQPWIVREERRVQVTNASPLPVQLAISVSTPFTTPIQTQLLNQGQTGIVPVTFNPTYLSESIGLLTMTVVPEGLVLKYPLRGSIDLVERKIQPEVPLSRNISGSSSTFETTMFSSSSSIEYNESGPFNLESTLSSLSWSSLNLGSSAIKSFGIRTPSDKAEKLVVFIEDPTKSFLLCHGKDTNLTKSQEMKFKLNPKQKHEISVQFTPSSYGQVVGRLKIRRYNCENERKTIGLYAFGGKGLLRADNISMDLYNNAHKLLLDPKFLSAVFPLQNAGDGPSFFSITQPAVEGCFVTVSPTTGVLDPGSQCRVNLKFEPTPSQIEELLQNDRRSEVTVTRLIVRHGDNHTRLRLNRLYLKNKKNAGPQLSLIMKNLREMSTLFPNTGYEEVNHLKDPQSSLCTMYKEGILEWTVDVLASRAALESVHLDSTQSFVDLEDTLVAENTVLNNTTLGNSSNVFPRDQFSSKAFKGQF